ncbi:type VI secretion system Vgr family protein [Azoarcus olearius]|uniref:Probable vgr-related protein n=1 Tax=Azoarcus sp. (strain BH72) TaxID=418699 RepID=A1KB80_AZOSB|nr:type VI secretion system Vgr family protein [Azoarcus olearius]CAL96086.1 probable vgr-related protein [Azoarcus olearius]
MNADDVLGALQANGISLFAQATRLLELHVVGDTPFPVHLLLPQRLDGREALSRCYRYELSCLSPDAAIELKTLLGRRVEIRLRLADGAARLFCGVITEMEATGADGGFARYRLVVEPALAMLAQRYNSRVFQDKDVVEIIAAVLDEHSAANPAWASFSHRSEVIRPLSRRSYCVQYRESDLAFIERLAAEEGLSYRFSHGSGELSVSSNAADDACGHHTLILFCADHPHPCSHTPHLRFHRTVGPESVDAVDKWQAVRRLQAGRTSLLSFDYKQAAPHAATAHGRASGDAGADGVASALEDYDPQTLYYAAGMHEAERYASQHQSALDRAGKHFVGAGNAAGLEPGTWFELHDHPAHGGEAAEERQFLVTELSFEAFNNLAADGNAGVPPYRNHFQAIRRHVPVVPAFRHSRHQRPTSPGATTATVVGPANEEIHTDEHGRIRIQFHWQRPQDHPDGGAALDEHASTWVRVALPGAGAQWGHQFIPRVGQEVVVSFLEGDMDRPLVTGVVYNGRHPPPTFSGAGQLPANKTLSGIQSREYRGQGYNELLFDDSSGQLRTKLSSEHAKTQLNQGYLTHPRQQGKAEPRGEGFELRTDAAGALRAARGLLLTAWQRLNATDRQLSRDETLALMEESLTLFKQFGDYAARHHALPADSEGHATLNEAVRNWESGSNTAPGAAATEKAGIIGISAPAGLALNTPQSIAAYAGRNLDCVAQQHLQLTAGQGFNVNAGKGISLFAHGDGLRAIAHHGKLELQSQHGDTELAAEQSIKLTASQGRIVGFAQQEIVLAVSGGAGLRLHGGDIELVCPGAFSVKAARHSMSGPASVDTALPAFGEGELGRRFRLVRPTDGGGMADLPYTITLDDGTVMRGTTNAEGETELLEGDRFRIARVEFHRANAAGTASS